jgi:hypothetical protein
MLSIPPAATMALSPVRICWAARATARRPEPEDHLIHVGGLKPGSGKCGLQGDRAQIVGVNGAQGAVEAADCCPCCRDDDNVVHVLLSFRGLSRALRHTTVMQSSVRVWG